MANAYQVAVNTTPVEVAGPTTPGLGENCRIRNTDATNVVYLGGNANNGAGGATALGATNGLSLGLTAPGNTVDMTVHTGAVYAVAANTTTVTVQVLRW